MKKILTIIMSFLFCFLVSCGSNNTNNNQTFTVELAESEYYEILSDNPVEVKKGASAAFHVDIIEGREFDSSEDGTFLETQSIFRVDNVQESCVVSFDTRPVGDCALTIFNNDFKGSYQVTPNKESYEVGDVVTVEVFAKDDDFMCYTFERRYRTEWNTDPTSMPVSFDEKLTFTIEDDTTLYMNYFIDGYTTIEYSANGGKTIDGDDSFTVDYRRNQYHLNPVTILGTYYLFNDGYTLESYNTKPDGTGIRVGIGSKIDYEYFVDNHITLYAQWKKWNEASDFEVEELEDDTLAISKYIGDSSLKEIVIPNDISGKTVKKISENAFDNLDVESLVLNLDLLTISENAVNNCDSLYELHMFTNIGSISKTSFKTNSLEKIYINSTVYSKNYTNHGRDITSQLDQIKAMDNERVIFVGQTTIRYNHYLSPFKEKYPNKDFYVYGMQEGANFALPLEILTHYLEEDDTVIIALSESYMKKDYVGSFTFTYLKYNFDLLSLINYQNYSDMFFASYEKFVLETRKGYDIKVYNSEIDLTMDKFGSITSGGVATNEENYDSSYTPRLNQYQKVEYYTYLDEIMDKSKVPSYNRYITWGTYNENSVKDITMFENYEAFVKENVKTFKYFDSIKDNIYTGEYFVAKSSVNLSTFGGNERIRRWLKQIPLQ